MEILNYYATGITANGRVSFLADNLKGIKKVFFITGGPDYTPFAEKVVSLWKKDSLDYIHNPYVNGSFEAIINNSRNSAVVFDIAPVKGIAASEYKNAEIIDLDKAVQENRHVIYRNALFSLKQDYIGCINSAYLYLAGALKVHDEWEKIYIRNMDFLKADKIALDLSEALMPGKKKEREAAVKHRFMGAATPDGAKDFIPDITKGLAKRYLIKGRPGTGKSTILKKIARRACESGFDTEIYHCGFDHNSLDMVIIRELGVCVFDSTSPHEYFPERDFDEIIDVYAQAVTPDTDEKYAAELEDIKTRYKSGIKTATSYLNTMKTINEEILYYYSRICDKDISASILQDFESRI